MDPNETSRDILLDYDEEDYQRSHTFWMIYSAVANIDTLIRVLSAMANVFIIFLIRKFPKLRTDEYSFVMNASLCHLLTVVSLPLTYLLKALVLDNYVAWGIFCSMDKIDVCLLFMGYNFVALLAIHSYVKNYCKRIWGYYERNRSNVTWGVYGGGILQIVGGIVGCLTEMEKHDLLLFLTNFLAMTLAVAAVSVAFFAKLKLGKPPANSPRFSLAFSAVFVAFWLPLVAVHVFAHFHGFTSVHHLDVALRVCKIVAFCNPCFSVYLLAKLDGNFAAARRKVCRCRWRDYESDFEEVDVEAEANGAVPL